MATFGQSILRFKHRLISTLICADLVGSMLSIVGTWLRYHTNLGSENARPRSGWPARAGSLRLARSGWPAPAGWSSGVV